MVAPLPSELDCNGRVLDLSSPKVMGVLNITPDSFSDGGQLYRNNRPDLDLALRHAENMLDEGASIIDIGGESTRPGAAPVSTQEEIDRVLPVVEKIAAELDVIISVDTSSPALMSTSAQAGAGLINDVRALEAEGALQAAADSGLPICLMHMQGQPETMQQAPRYHSVVNEVAAYLQARITACSEVGITNQRILLDPGFGFGKALAHNLILLKQLSALHDLGCHLLVGMSRKSMISAALKREVEDRLPASLALAVMAVERGAAIVRVHDVAATLDAIEMTTAVLAEQ